jgi:tetratricopeptide (TPR) repeat protein
VRRWLLAGLALLMAASSCAYYNTFYLARKNYFLGTSGEPYPIDQNLQNRAQFTRSMDFSKKVLTQYPNSKWVDDAYVLWACSLLGQDDPIKTVTMLEDFPVRFPNSPIRNEATFYLGVGYRQSRKYRNAVRSFDEFLKEAPKHKLAPYAHFERSRALMALDEPAEAAQAATRVLEDFPKSSLADRARIARADALFEARQFESSRADYQYLGDRAETDEERLRFLLREADCLEAGQKYEDALSLLGDAITYERPPVLTDTTGGRVAQVQQVPGYDRYGRLLNRIGTVQLTAGRLQLALDAYRRVVEDYPRDPLATEAQFRIGYAYETLGDDFDRARTEYQAARIQGGQVGFGLQADERLRNLERLAQFRGEGQDSTERFVEAGFLLAEQYLFELDKPERALEEYQKIAHENPGTTSEAKALNAQAWVLSRKYQRHAQADSIFWYVIHNHPATEAQLAARDYLEMEGKEVPAELIKFPEPPVVVQDTMPPLTPVPDSVPGIGELGHPDSLTKLGRAPSPPGVAPDNAPPDGGFEPDEPVLAPALIAADSLARLGRDSTANVPDTSVTKPLLPDSLPPPPRPIPQPRDTSRKFDK